MANIKELHASVDLNWWTVSTFLFKMKQRFPPWLQRCSKCSSESEGWLKGSCYSTHGVSGFGSVIHDDPYILVSYKHANSQVRSWTFRRKHQIRLLSWIVGPPKCLYPNPKSFEYIALHDTRDFAVLMLKLLRWRDYPRYMDGPSIIMSLYDGDRTVRVTGAGTTEAWSPW